MRGVAQLLEPEARRLGVRLELRLADELPELEVDRIQIEQVIMNLVRNGFDAMASAPPTISVISCVISACRFGWMRSSSASSAALLAASQAH